MLATCFYSTSLHSNYLEIPIIYLHKLFIVIYAKIFKTFNLQVL